MSAIVFDTETTGLKPPVLLVEAAWRRIDDIATLRPVESFCQRYNPGKPIETGAMATHHILDEDLVDCPPSGAFSLPDDVEYLIGHNIDYDWTVIGKPQVKRICTLAIARKLWKNVDSHSQSALAYQLTKDRARMRETLKNAHSAATDVRLCSFILKAELSIIQPDSWDSLWQYSESARVPEVMPFGKHGGVPIKDLPKEYVVWALNNLKDMDEYLRKALESV